MDGYASGPRCAAERFIERRELQAVARGKRHQMRIGDVVTAGKRGQRRCRGVVGEKLMSGEGENIRQRLPGVREAGPLGRAHADAQKAHLADRAGGEAGETLQPAVRLAVAGVRLPRAGGQQVHIQQMAHSSSSRIALIRSAVMGGAPGGATSTARPNSPRIKLA